MVGWFGREGLVSGHLAEWCEAKTIREFEIGLSYDVTQSTGTVASYKTTIGY